MIAMNEKANMTKVMAVVAVLALALCAFAALMPAETEAATNEQGYHGDVDAFQPFYGKTNIVIDQDTTVTANGFLYIESNFRVAEDVTLTIEKGGVVYIGGGFVQIDGEVEVTGNGTNDTLSDGDVIKKITEAAATDISSLGGKSTLYIVENTSGTTPYKDSGVVVNDTITVAKNAQLVYDGANGGVLINNGGSLNVVKSGSNVATISGLNVDIAVGGTFAFEGAVAESMIVSAYGTVTGETLKSVSSVTIEPGTPGDAKDYSDLTFTTTSKNVTGYYMSGDDVDTKLVREFALNVAGTVAYDDKVTFDGRIFDADNTPYTSTLFVSEEIAKIKDANIDKYDSKVSAKAIVSSLTVAKDGNVVNNTYIQVTEKIAVNGSEKDGYGSLENNGTIELVGTMTVDFNDNITGSGVFAVNGGSATISGADTGDADALTIYGAYYADTSGTNPVLYITDLAAAIDGAVAAEEDEVHVSSAGADNKYDAYTVTADDSVPADIELDVVDVLTVAEGVTFTFDLDATANITNKIYVEGTVVDNNLDLDEAKMKFEVKIVSEGEETNTYTSLANALTIITSGTIYLYDNVTISGEMTIGADVTVMYAEGKAGTIGFEDKDSSLIIDGTVILGENDKIDTAVDKENATVTVNNMLKYVSSENINGKIYGVYFEGALGEDADGTKYVTSVDVAATNSAEITGPMEVYGNIAMGDVTFTQGEDKQLVIKTKTDDKQTVTGNVTLAGGAQMDSNGVFTGSVTDGTNTVAFNKATGATIEFHSEETAEGTTTDMCLSGALIAGDVTVSAGTVVIGEETKIGNGTENGDGSLTVASGATLEVAAPLTIWTAYYNPLLIAKEFPVYTDGAIESTFASLFVEGTLNIVQGGSMDAAVSVIDGTVTVAQRAGAVHFDGAIINGTVTAERSIAFDTAKVVGTIDGKITVEGLIAMPGSTVVADDINGGDNAVTTYYINGEEYATVYATDGMPVAALLIFADVPGVQIDTAVFYSDAAMTQVINGVYTAAGFPVITGTDFSVNTLAGMFGTTAVGTYDNVYIAMDPAEVEGTVSVGTGLDLYIDNVRVTGGQDFVLSVGTHTVSFDVKAGYDGANATITFNGQTVQNGGSITITADMTEYTLVASGAAPSQGQVVIDQTGGDDGMGITDYLLIILVILVIVLAIFVALRMMRS